MTIITYDIFEQVNLRSGTIVKVEKFPKAKKPAYKVWADFGDKIGILILLVGFADQQEDICLITVAPRVPNGQKMH